MTAARTPFHQLPRATQAALMCSDQRFQTFAATRASVAYRFTESAAAEWLRSFCGVTSRRYLDTSPEAARRFDTLKTEFDAFTGKIATPNR